MNGLICDNCAVVLAFDARNGQEDSNGEKAAWLVIEGGGLRFDACSRSCATELLADGGELAGIIDAWLEVISGLARSIKEDRESDDDDEAGGPKP